MGSVGREGTREGNEDSVGSDGGYKWRIWVMGSAGREGTREGNEGGN